MAQLIHVDFKSKKVINRSQTANKVKTWQCNSCGENYPKDGGVKGIEFAKGFVVCSVCVEQAYGILKEE